MSDQSRAFLGAFNARWLSPEEVAQQFVPIPQFYRLVNSRHSLLLGPRGCGKTTLLKMLTRRALGVWSLRAGEEAAAPESQPAYEAVYVPSDVRWSYELRRASSEPHLSETEVELVQRVLIAASVLCAVVETFEGMVEGGSAREEAVCAGLASLWGLKRTVPRFKDLRRSAELLAAEVRGALNKADIHAIRSLLDGVPSVLVAHALDCAIASCRLFQETVPGAVRGGKWALCFDELEIAPEWLRRELLESLRSVDHTFYLKLTYSPLLPSGLLSAPEPAQDYQTIRLWHSHVENSRPFCDGLARRFLELKFAAPTASADRFLGHSALAADDQLDEDEGTYERGSAFYREMVELARDDRGFREALAGRGVNPDDPYSESPALRDAFFRKVKPVVLLRRAFLKGERSRSRKVASLYSGMQAVYAMSEGNPRWLLGLLTDLYDRWLVDRRMHRGIPVLPSNEQAKVLYATAQRFHAAISAAPSEDDQSVGSALVLSELVDLIGNAIAEGMLGPDFPTDPFGSVVVDEQPRPALYRAIEKALELGALVHVGAAEDDVPRRVRGGRFRVAFMLSPIYRLPFRNYREITLSTLFERGRIPGQMDLFGASAAER